MVNVKGIAGSKLETKNTAIVIEMKTHKYVHGTIYDLVHDKAMHFWDFAGICNFHMRHH